MTAPDRQTSYDPRASPRLRRLGMDYGRRSLAGKAVSDAATSLNSFTQNRLGRHDISDEDLMGEAFTDRDPRARQAPPAVSRRSPSRRALGHSRSTPSRQRGTLPAT